MVHNLDNEDLLGMGWVLEKMLRTVLNSPAYYTILPVISGSCYECFESEVGGDLLVVLLQWESLGTLIMINGTFTETLEFSHHPSLLCQ